MGSIDDLLKEKQVIGINDTYIAPGQISASELGSLGLGTADIADASLTAVKFNTSARDATKGLTGLGAAALQLVPDGTNLELDAGVTPAKKVRIADDGVDVDALEALSANGLTGGAGSAWAVNPDGTGLEISGGKVALKNLGTTHAKLGTGANLRRFNAAITPVVAGSTITSPIMTCPDGKSYYITKISVAAQTVAADANGTITADVIKYDQSGTADVDVVSAADYELTAAKIGEGWTVITAASANVMDEFDTLRVAITANDEGADGVDATDVAGVITVEYYEVV